MSFELQDKIGRADLVNKICSLVDNLAEDEHFCLALNGEWGSGKTFVMHMIEEQLSQHDEYLIIRYDAWENSFYTDPLIAILSCVIDGMQERLSHIEGFKKILSDGAKEKLAEIEVSDTKIGKLFAACKKFSQLIEKFEKPFSKDTSEKSIAGFTSYRDLLNDVKESLNKITTQEYGFNQGKLIIMVDEIDRCLPNEQLKILERLHHLFDVKNCAVICAMNNKSVEQNIHTLYGTDGKEYLRKFLDFRFKLSMSSEIYLAGLFKDLLSTLNKTNQKPNWPIITNLAWICITQGTKQTLKAMDNRELSRYFDGVNQVCNAFGWEDLSEPYLFFIIIGLYIRKNCSPEFLSASNINANQQHYQEIRGNMEDVIHTKYEMPYFDYIDEYIGLDRTDLDIDLCRQYRNEMNIFAYTSWCFNEIVFYSVQNYFHHSSMRTFNNEFNPTPEKCKQLRELICLYAGGEE